MLSSKIALWEVLLNSIGIILWCITIIYFLRTRLKKKDDDLKTGYDINHKQFNNELHFQLLKQQSERVLENIYESISRGCFTQQNLMENSPNKSRDISTLLNSNDQMTGYRVIDNNTEPDKMMSATEQYGEVVRLIDMGLNEKEIVKKVSLPRSEVKLIKKIQDKDNQSAGKKG